MMKEKMQGYDITLINCTIAICREADANGLTMPRLGIEFLESLVPNDFEDEVEDFTTDLIAGFVVATQNGFLEDESKPGEYTDWGCSMSMYQEQRSKYHENNDGAWNELIADLFKSYIRHLKKEQEIYFEPVTFPAVLLAKLALKKWKQRVRGAKTNDAIRLDHSL